MEFLVFNGLLSLPPRFILLMPSPNRSERCRVRSYGLVVVVVVVSGDGVPLPHVVVVWF
jgi:hypothetical protein